MAEFTTALTNFQKVQRQAAEREKEFVARVRASSRVSVSTLHSTVKMNLIFSQGLMEIYFRMIF